MLVPLGGVDARAWLETAVERPDTRGGTRVDANLRRGGTHAQAVQREHKRTHDNRTHDDSRTWKHKGAWRVHPAVLSQNF